MSADKPPTTNFFSEPDFHIIPLIVIFHLISVSRTPWRNTSKTGAVETVLTSKDASSHQCGNPETRGDNADRNSKTRWHPLENLRTSANLRCWFSPTSSSNIFTPRQTTTLASNYNCIHLCRHQFRNNYLLLSFLPTQQMLHDLQTKHCSRS